MIIGAPTLRLKSDYLALVTLGFGEIIPEVFRNGEDINGFNLTNGAKGIDPIDPIPLGPFHAIFPGVPANLGPFDNTYKFLVYALLTAFAIFVSLRIRVGRLGRAWLAIREDELAASMMGVPLMRTKLAAYAVGAAHRRPRRRRLRDPHQRRHPRQLPVRQLDHPARDGRARRHGQRLGRARSARSCSSGSTRRACTQFGNSFNCSFGTDINFPSYNFLIFGAAADPHDAVPPRGPAAGGAHAPGAAGAGARRALEAVGADLEGTTV